MKINNFPENKNHLNIKFLSGSKIKSSWCINYKNEIPILSLLSRQSYINIYLNKLTDDDFSWKLIKKYQLEDYREKDHNGKLGNDWKYIVSDENSFQGVFDLFTSYLENIK